MKKLSSSVHYKTHLPFRRANFSLLKSKYKHFRKVENINQLKNSQSKKVSISKKKAKHVDYGNFMIKIRQSSWLVVT